MSRIFQCDRCGATYKHRVTQGPTFVPEARPVTSERSADLCPDCTTSLGLWFQRLTAEIVRCGECGYRNTNGYCAKMVMRTADTDFCSYGERKEARPNEGL